MRCAEFAGQCSVPERGGIPSPMPSSRTDFEYAAVESLQVFSWPLFNNSGTTRSSNVPHSSLTAFRGEYTLRAIDSNLAVGGSFHARQSCLFSWGRDVSGGDDAMGSGSAAPRSLEGSRAYTMRGFGWGYTPMCAGCENRCHSRGTTLRQQERPDVEKASNRYKRRAHDGRGTQAPGHD